jgi:tetratricopeptide (TPR) repeat protein
MAVCAIVRVAVMGHFATASPLRGFKPIVVRVAIALVGEHAKVFFWPVHLSEFREFGLAASLHSPWPWVTLAILAVAAIFRKRNPLLSFLVLWWFVMLLPCFDYRQLSFPLVEDQFSYLPSVGLCLALGYLAFVWLPQRFTSPRPAEIAIGGLVVVATLWGVQSVRAIPPWYNNNTLIDYALKVSPNAALVHISHGVDLQFRDNDLNGAAREFQMALRLNAQSVRPLAPLAYSAYIGLGQVALLQGREAEALQYFDKAVHLLPNYNFAYNVLGSVYFPRGDYARAAEYFRRAVSANPMDTGARFYLGTCLMKLAQPAQAAEQFHAARVVDPDYYQAFEAEARALEAAGDPAGAAAVRRLKPHP